MLKRTWESAGGCVKFVKSRSAGLGKRIFQVLDHSGRGKVQVELLRQLLTRIGARVPPEEMDRLLAEVNALREIDYNQFLEVFAKPTGKEASL